MLKWILLKDGVMVAESDSILDLCRIIDKSPKSPAGEARPALYEIRERGKPDGDTRQG